VRCRGQAERASDGTLTGLVGIFQDITERKDAERIRNTLAERTVVSTQADKVGAWELDIIKNSLTWDTVMYGLYDQIESNITPSYDLWAQSITDEDRDRVTAEFGQAISGKKQFNTMFRILLPNGETRSIRAQATVLRNAANEPERMVGINWDITEIRSLADQIRNEQAALNALELEKLYQHERQWSTTFQRAVLPVALPSVIGCSFDAVYEPGLSNTTAGGDWYDAIHLSDGRILVSIGDVSGSGLQAAVVVGVVRQIIRGISQLHADPMIILDAADRALCLEYPEVYVSAWVGLIDLVTRTITYASAGHPAPLLVSKSGTVRELDDPSTTLMGLRKGHKGQPSTVRLDQGDTLVLYTDGLTEAGRDVVAGNKSLHDAAILIETAHGPAPAKSIRRQVIPDGSNDDVAILVVRTDYEEAERHIDRWTFAIHDGDAARQVRNNFVASLKKQLFSFDACANAELVFGELIGNVVRHASSTMNVEVAVNHAGPDTVLHVMDLGGGFNHASRLPRDPYAEAGRGLFLIAALTEDFTVSERPDGGSHARAVLLRNTP
jgi:serine phosphatase RsbU (regulator of sigma subunit)/anti-sigma regulatory factor (Ser/Thr protein kinase)